MECFEVTGGTALTGRVRVTGAKNSALKLMAAALLAAGTTTIDEVPDILDVADHGRAARRLGCDVDLERTPGSVAAAVVVDVPEKPSTEADYDLVRRMRASISVLGPLVARCGSARVALPGGDAIGSRGLDMHISGLERLGARSTASTASWSPPRRGWPARRSGWTSRRVGATENLLMAAVLAGARRSSTTPPASRRSWTSARCSSRWAPASTASAPPPITVEASTGCAGHLRDRPGPDRRRHVGVRGGR